MSRKGDAAGAETVIVTRQVKEWQPTHDDPLPKIHATIDSWGRDGSTSATATPTLMASARDLDHEYVEAQVDKITKRVKGTQKVTVTETVTEWVEGPMGSGPMAVSPEGGSSRDDRAGAETDADSAWSTKQFTPSDRPKRRFSLFGLGKKDKAETKAKPAKGKDKAPVKGDKDYQPQCMALTEDGQQCRNSARGDSKYCSSHKGYQPPTAKGLAQRIEGDAWDPDDHITDHQSVRSKDTRPKVAKAKDTRLRTRKAAKPSKKGGKKKR